MPTETGRHRLYEKIKEAWGENNAAELMSYLPPVGWADVATKQDLNVIRLEMDLLRSDLRREMADMRTDLGDKIAKLESKVDSNQTSILRWNVGTLMTMTGIFAFFVGFIR